MAAENDFPTRGKVIEVSDDAVVFAPANTTYRMHLRTPGGRYDGPVNSPVDCVIRAISRKLYSVPSGGAFLVPIDGPPKIVQGRVRHINSTFVVLQAAANVLVKMPQADSGIELATGPIALGSLVNATLMPGTTMELLAASAVATG